MIGLLFPEIRKTHTRYSPRDQVRLTAVIRPLSDPGALGVYFSKLSGLSVSILILGLSVSLLGGCSETHFDPPEETTNGAQLGKADVTVGPVSALSCEVENSFVRRGSFARLNVDARDERGDQSRNYRLEVTPAAGARVVQRDQVIFDLDGLYQVRCCSNDTDHCDEVAVRVGEVEPALSVSLAPFSEGNATLTGHAMDHAGKPALVYVNGIAAESDERGRFNALVPVRTGLNRYEVIARGSEGAESVRRAWTVGGPFLKVDSTDPTAARLNLSSDAYPMISEVLTKLLERLLIDYAQSPSFRQSQTGSSLGYSWEVMPNSIDVAQAQVELTEGARYGDLALRVSLRELQVLAEGRTRFSVGSWKTRDIKISADLNIGVQFHLHASGVEIGEVSTRVDGLEVEISDLPGFLEDVLGRVFERTIKRELVKVVESVGDRGLNDILTGFEIREEVTLPEPLQTTLEVSGRVVELEASSEGIRLGLGLAIDGETDPARVSAPGPVRTDDAPPQFEGGSLYELALDLDVMNRLFFAAWQTGGLDFAHTIPRPLGDEEIFRDELLTLFVTPQLPPVVRAGERSGELVVELGALHVDGVLASELGVLNCALDVGVTFRALLSGDEESIFVSSALSALDVDVLIAPAGWDVEPTRRLIERALAEDVIPKYAELLSGFPLPEADLSGLNLEGINALKINQLKVSSAQGSLSLSADLELE